MKAEQIKIENDGATTYIGIAVSGASTSDEKWHIKKVTHNEAGDVIAVQASEGKEDQIYAWDDRADLEYA